jgi:hypothetical protein
MAVVGVLLLLAFIVVPSLREPAVMAGLTGMYTVVGTVGAAVGRGISK